MRKSGHALGNTMLAQRFEDVLAPASGAYQAVLEALRHALLNAHPAGRGPEGGARGIRAPGIKHPLLHLAEPRRTVIRQPIQDVAVFAGALADGIAAGPRRKVLKRDFPIHHASVEVVVNHRRIAAGFSENQFPEIDFGTHAFGNRQFLGATGRGGPAGQRRCRRQRPEQGWFCGGDTHDGAEFLH